jgi:beta-lactamase class A
MKATFFLPILCSAMLLLQSCGESQPDFSSAEIQEAFRFNDSIAAIGKDMKLAVYGSVIETGASIAVMGDSAMPMQSTYKFPLALTVLHLCEQKGIALDSPVPVLASDLVPDTWSPMRDSLGTKGFSVSVKDLIYFVTSCSDNIACDVLFRFCGGTQTVDSYIAAKGFPEIEIRNTERELHENWRRQYQNTTPPKVMTELLSAFFKGDLLNKQHTAYLLDLLIQNKTGDARIRAGIPKGVVVADKTGTCYPDDGPGTVNDIGIINLPDGKHLALSVYITDARVDIDQAQAAIAAAARLVYAHFTEHP